ncbi:hypothetical protein MIR68_001717 [Amoeboaphelidium protococcarum]|nr:hypothetical protein MIR68_001717 [Amoeboaphelidium protococcarum]
MKVLRKEVERRGDKSIDDNQLVRDVLSKLPSDYTKKVEVYREMKRYTLTPAAEVLAKFESVVRGWDDTIANEKFAIGQKQHPPIMTQLGKGGNGNSQQAQKRDFRQPTAFGDPRQQFGPLDATGDNMFINGHWVCSVCRGTNHNKKKCFNKGGDMEHPRHPEFEQSNQECRNAIKRRRLLVQQMRDDHEKVKSSSQ